MSCGKCRWHYTKQMPARKPQLFILLLPWLFHYTKQMPARKPQLERLPVPDEVVLYQTNACPQTTTESAQGICASNYTKQMPARKPQHPQRSYRCNSNYTKQMPARKPQLITAVDGPLTIIPNKCLPANHNVYAWGRVCIELYQTNACPQTTTIISKHPF